MSVPIEAIVPGAVFQFKKAQRRVVERTGNDIKWEYADGVKRAGRAGGVQWIHYFAYDAYPLSAGQQVPNPKKALRMVLDAMGALCNRNELYGHGFSEEEIDFVLASAEDK